MKTLILLILGLSSAVASAQVAISASSVTDSFNRPVPLARLCFTPVNANSAVSGFRVGSTQVIPEEVCGVITAGVLQSGLDVEPSPTGIGYHVYVKASNSNAVLRDYCVVPITGSSWTLDTLDCPSAGPLPTVGYVQSVNGAAGSFSISGPGVTCSTVSGGESCTVTGGGGSPGDPTTTQRLWFGNSWLLQSTATSLTASSWASTSGTLVVTSSGTNTLLAGHDVMMDADAPACVTDTMQPIASANSTTFTITGTTCGTASGTAFHYQSGDTAIPEYSQKNEPNYIGHGSTFNYAVGGSSLSQMVTNYSTLIHPAVVAAISRAAGAPVYVYLYNNDNAGGMAGGFTLAGYYLSLAQSLHAEAANVYVFGLGLGTSGDPNNISNTDTWSAWAAANTILEASVDPFTAPATGEYLDRFIALNGSTADPYCYKTDFIHLNNNCTKNVADWVAANVPPNSNHQIGNVPSLDARNNLWLSTDVTYRTAGGYHGFDYVNDGWGELFGSPALGRMPGWVWHYGDFTPGDGKCFGLYPTFGNDHTTQPLQARICAESNGVLNFGESTDRDTGTGVHFAGIRMGTTPTAGASCASYLDGNKGWWYFGTDSQVRYCDSTTGLWTTPSWSGSSGTYLNDTGAAGFVYRGSSVGATSIGTRAQLMAAYWSDSTCASSPYMKNDGTCGNPSGGGSYTLPAATSSSLGGVKCGTGTACASDGTISVSGGSSGNGWTFEHFYSCSDWTFTNGSGASFGCTATADGTVYYGVAQLHSGSGYGWVSFNDIGGIQLTNVGGSYSFAFAGGQSVSANNLSSSVGIAGGASGFAAPNPTYFVGWNCGVTYWTALQVTAGTAVVNVASSIPCQSTYGDQGTLQYAAVQIVDGAISWIINGTTVATGTMTSASGYNIWTDGMTIWNGGSIGSAYTLFVDWYARKNPVALP
jgi:hypothetical protein